MVNHPAIVILGVSALPVAGKIKAAIGGAIHGPAGVSGLDIAYKKATSHIQTLFRDGRAIIGLCASGILIRALAPVIKDKRDEPPVIAVAEDGSAIVPLLGGHHGANTLARVIAKLLDGHAAITTATDLRLGAALDEPPEGYVLANPQDMKTFAAAVIAGAGVTVEGAMPEFPIEFPKAVIPAKAGIHRAAGLNLEIGAGGGMDPGLRRDDGRCLRVTVTEKAVAGSPEHLVYHPRTLALGVGCERGTGTRELADLVRMTLQSACLAATSITSINTIDVKADETALHDLAKTLGAPLRFFTASELNAEAPRLENPSERVMKEVGCPGVAEGAALAAAGPDAELLVAKTKSARATVAIARAPSPILELRGTPRGAVSVIGLGPGDRMTRSPEATRALQDASDWVGYGLYLDLAGDTRIGQTEHRFPLGEEEARVRHAIALAKEGKRVALVCSGDPGIYAMATLVFEIIDLEPCRIAVDVIPGISAFQAAAARAGAMIGHDFCCISLSDLLTPWEVIEKRLHAAAAGDFVVAFYNPRSQKRRDQLERAIAILTPCREPDTPVIIAGNLGRPMEAVTIVALKNFDPAVVDMLTLVMVGSSQSKSFLRGDGKRHAYTPRGYAKKRGV